MLRKLRYFSEQIAKAGLVAIPRPVSEQAYQLEELEAKLEELENELRQINVNTEKLRRSHSELVELQLVLEKAGGQGQGDTPSIDHTTRGCTHVTRPPQLDTVSKAPLATTKPPLSDCPQHTSYTSRGA